MRAKSLVEMYLHFNPDCKGEGWGITVQEGGLCRGTRAESWKERPQELLAAKNSYKHKPVRKKCWDIWELGISPREVQEHGYKISDASTGLCWIPQFSTGTSSRENYFSKSLDLLQAPFFSSILAGFFLPGLMSIIATIKVNKVHTECVHE